MRLPFKAATLVICALGIGVAAIGWGIYRHRANERKLADEARAYQARAERGDAKAEVRLAYMYAHGEGVPQSYAEALSWRRKAAEQGDPVGEDGVGYMYFYGQGVPQDYAAALAWSLKAADQGDAMGEESAGDMYAKGLGVQQDYAEALRWYRKSADHGYANAEYDLGAMYYRGWGVPQDRAEADRWFHKAADDGDETAQRFLGLKGTGPDTFMKWFVAWMLPWCLLLLGKSFSGKGDWAEQRRTTGFTGLLGLFYVGVDLYGSYRFGPLQTGLGIDAFRLVRHGLGGTFLMMCVSLIYSLERPQRAKMGLKIAGAIFIAFNIVAMMHLSWRHLVPAVRVFWIVNGNLFGAAIVLAVFWWRRRRDDGGGMVEMEATDR